MKPFKFALTAFAMVSLSACSSAPSTNLGTISGSEVSVLFQDFEPGTTCTATGASGSVTQNTMPGKIDFALDERESVDITCQTPDGSRYSITAHTGYTDATGTMGITVYPDGRSFATYGSTGGLVQAKKTDAVTKIE